MARGESSDLRPNRSRLPTHPPGDYRGEIHGVDRPLCGRRWLVEGSFLIFAGIVAVGAVLIVAVLGRADKGRTKAPVKERVRRGTGHALLGLQQFIEPSVEHVF